MRQNYIEKLYKSQAEGNYTLPEGARFIESDNGISIRYDRKQHYSKKDALIIAKSALNYLASNGYEVTASAKALRKNGTEVVRGYFDIDVSDSQYSFTAKDGTEIKNIKPTDMIYVSALGMRFEPNKEKVCGTYRIYFNDSFIEPKGSFDF